MSTIFKCLTLVIMDSLVRDNLIVRSTPFLDAEPTNTYSKSARICINKQNKQISAQSQNIPIPINKDPVQNYNQHKLIQNQQLQPSLNAQNQVGTWNVQPEPISQNPNVKYDQPIVHSTYLVDQSPYLINYATLVNPVFSVQHNSITDFIHNWFANIQWKRQ